MTTLPVLAVRGRTLPEAWENSLIALRAEGRATSSEHAPKGTDRTLDCTMLMTVDEPLAEPRIHRCLPAGLEDLWVYVEEVLNGVHDHWINPAAGQWSYTYHRRLTDYQGVDQLAGVLDTLAKTPHSRRAQAITWVPRDDLRAPDPPCFVAGTPIATPSGVVPVDAIHAGDTVWAFCPERRDVVASVAETPFARVEPCVRIRHACGLLEASRDQLVWTETGWKRAAVLTTGDRVFVPSSVEPVTDMMVLGFLHGDGWLTRAESRHRRISFAIHPKASAAWAWDWLRRHTDNAVREQSGFYDTAVARGQSRKISVDAPALWRSLADAGAPLGRKHAGLACADLSGATDCAKAEFLTGLFSAEGCIHLRPGHGGVSLELGMRWAACIQLASSLLNGLGIGHQLYDSHGLHSLRVHRLADVRRALDTFDFRLDSRKQARYLLLKVSLEHTDRVLAGRLAAVNSAREDRACGTTYRLLRERYPAFNQRWLKEGYAPTHRFRVAPSLEVTDVGVWSPVFSVVELGERRVYDFGVHHEAHAIVAAGVAAHNCLQRLWMRLVGDSDDLALVMNCHWRSRDALKAAFMNLFALSELQRWAAAALAERLGAPVRCGRLMDVSDSYHLYLGYADEWRAFWVSLADRSFAERTYTTDFAAPFRDEALERLRDERAKGR